MKEFSRRKTRDITQKNDASSIGNKRGMARKAKKHSSSRMRQRLKKETENVSLC